MLDFPPHDLAETSIGVGEFKTLIRIAQVATDAHICHGKECQLCAAIKPLQQLVPEPTDKEEPEERGHLYAELKIKVRIFHDTDEGARVDVITHPQMPYVFWMAACEYLLWCTAKESGMGFERAMDNLVRGAMTYKTKKRFRGNR